jgi:anti-sigma-K factor RskA
LNIQEYISSGIVESYVLGIASPEEREEFERLSAEYPALREARDAFELSLEDNLLKSAVKPPAGLKRQIFAEIASEEREMLGTPILRAVGHSARGAKLGWVRFLAVAAVVLLMCSTALNFYFFSQYKEYISKYDELVANQSQMASANQNLQTKLLDYDSAFSKMKDPAMAMVKMPGTSGHLTSLTTVYWDTHSKDVYLLVNNLPQPEANKQYQLWAIVDGKPVNAGIFDVQEGLSFVRMKNIPKAQAFAITLEKKGGSLTPNMEAMFVIGKVTG